MTQSGEAFDVHIDWYEFGDHLGAGAYGTVYRAKDTRNGGDVAIKVLSDSSPAFVGRLRRETQMLRGLDHPGIVRVFGTGVDATRHFLVMEFLDGASLDVVMKKARIDPKQALTIAVKVAEALAHAHAHDIVHRDVKPANVMLTRDGQIKLMDFGLAKPMQKGQTLTGDGILVGTPSYTAPELIRGERATPGCDQHALAAMIYELLAGVPPFDGPNSMAILMARMRGEPKPLVEVRPGTPEAVSQFIARGLAMKASARFPTLADFALEAKKAMAELAG